MQRRTVQPLPRPRLPTPALRDGALPDPAPPVVGARGPAGPRPRSLAVLPGNLVAQALDDQAEKIEGAKDVK